MSRLRLRAPSPALIVSIVALVVALGGTSYAAFTLPNNSVGTSQLKNKAVTNGKLAPQSVGTAKIRNGAVTAPLINPTGLTVPNATNATNATNAARLTSIQIVRGPNTTVNPNTIANQTVVCPTGTVAINGEQLNGGGNTVSTNEVSIGGSSVTVYINNTSPTTAFAWHAFAICAGGSSVGQSARTASELAK
jgi:hypothetical protein